MEYILRPTDSFIVTGILYRGKRFKSIHTNSYRYGMGINLWHGSVWLYRDNKRILIKRVTN